MLIRETARIARKSHEQISPGIKRLLGLSGTNALTVLASYYPMITFTRKEGGVIRMKLPQNLSPERVMRLVPQHLSARIDGHGLLLSIPAEFSPQSRTSSATSKGCGHEGALSDLRVPQSLAEGTV